MSLALLFPGQGVQHPEMLRWIDEHPLARPVLDQMAQRIGMDWRAQLHHPDWSSRNGVAQCLLTGVLLASWQALAPLLPEPALVAGYSVGEIAAFGAAGVFDASEAIELAARRAQAMDASAAVDNGGLISATGVSASRIAEICARMGLAVAIHLGPDRWVLGGALADLQCAQAELWASGAESVTLRVSVASHTPQMQPAAEAFEALVEPMCWRTARAVVVTNVDGAGERRPQALKLALARQISRTVQWHRSMETIAERMPRCVLEVGPGTTLSRMWATRHPDIPTRSADEFHSAEAVAVWVRKMLA